MVIDHPSVLLNIGRAGADDSTLLGIWRITVTSPDLLLGLFRVFYFFTGPVDCFLESLLLNCIQTQVGAS